MALLDVKNLCVDFHTDQGTVHAVRDISFSVGESEAVGIVGESGSGKSVTMYSVMGLLAGNGSITGGSVSLNGQEITESAFPDHKAYEAAMSKIRGNQMAMIFQDPMTFLNPVVKIGKQITEVIKNHQKVTDAEARARAIELMGQVGIPSPEKRLNQYPHEFSGGMRQRIIIAIALANNPKLIIADEPTTALDVTIQAQILDLLRNLKDQINSSIMFITHDLGVIAEMADYVVVMYAGRIVEQGTAEEIFSHPAHPYTIGLMASKPVVGRQVDKLYSIPGKVPNPINMPNYCYFKDRCEMCVNGCEGDYPCEVSISPTHKVSCYRYYDGKRPDLDEVVEEELAEGKENGKEGE